MLYEALAESLHKKVPILMRGYPGIRYKVRLTVLPFVLDVEVFTVAVIEVSGLGVFGVR